MTLAALILGGLFVWTALALAICWAVTRGERRRETKWLREREK